jgi:acyl-coenzyme A thioesterase PaaI-like protein
MTEASPTELARLRREYAHCFGCGPDNPLGLRLDGFERDGDTVRAEFVPRSEYRGFSDILHGGIIATALDEILAWTAILVENTMVVTGKLELRYRKPAPADATYLLEGTLLESQGRRLVIGGTCRVGETLIAEATGLFIAAGVVASAEPTGDSAP